MQKNFNCVYIFLFCPKARLQVLKLEFCWIKLKYKPQINLQLTGKISLTAASTRLQLKFDLEHGRLFP